MPVDARGLDEATSRLLDPSVRLVGWGTGSVFDYYHGLHPFHLDYLVDNDASRWGHARRGIPIVSPDRLKADEPGRTIVIVYSAAWPQIQRQLAALGPFGSVAASVACADPSIRSRFGTVQDLMAAPRPVRRPGGRDAIVVQGPVVPAVTARVLRVVADLNPSARVILSSWRDSNPAELDAVANLADDVVLSERPTCGGVQNRNYQIVSTRAGVERAVAHGAEMILKTRTDLAVLSPSIFEAGRSWCDRVGHRAARAAGLRERLIVPNSFTRKYLLYHASDLVMLGTAEDVLAYWSAPLDPRRGDLVAPARLDQSLAAFNLEGNPAESYLGVRFCERLGRRVEGTLADSWAYYRDLFAVVDNDWFELLWFKNPSMPDVAVRGGVRQLVTQSFWAQLEAGDPAVARAASVDPAVATLRELVAA